VLVAISGVQKFIGESRSTADLFSGSELASDLAKVMMSVIPDSSALVLPSGDRSLRGAPNRVVVLADQGGSELAAAMASKARATWEQWLDDALPSLDRSERITPGFPAIQWVVVPVDRDGYPGAWAMAQNALKARKRIKDFPGYRVRQDAICSLTGRWPAVRQTGKQVMRRGESLSAAGHVKRWYARHHDERFQSTWSIASAPYRDAIIRAGQDYEDLWDAVVDLNSAVEAPLSAKMWPAASSASAVIPPIAVTATMPPLPKVVSRLPSAL